MTNKHRNAMSQLEDYLHELSLDGSWPTTGDVQYGDGHATLLIDPISWPETTDPTGSMYPWKGKSFILGEDNYGFKDVYVFHTAELAQAAFDNWSSMDEEEENNNA